MAKRHESEHREKDLRLFTEGGTGKPEFIPVLTKIAFYAEKKGGVVIGGFECLALAPAATTGIGSGDFTVNAMYVTGQIETAKVQGDTATLTGTATITGLGAGSDAPFKFVVRKGGPGATAVLTTEGSLRLVFREILLEGSFQVFSDRDWASLLMQGPTLAEDVSYWGWARTCRTHSGVHSSPATFSQRN